MFLLFAGLFVFTHFHTCSLFSLRKILNKLQVIIDIYSHLIKLLEIDLLSHIAKIQPWQFYIFRWFCDLTKWVLGCLVSLSLGWGDVPSFSATQFKSIFIFRSAVCPVLCLMVPCPQSSYPNNSSERLETFISLFGEQSPVQEGKRVRPIFLSHEIIWQLHPLL